MRQDEKLIAEAIMNPEKRDENMAKITARMIASNKIWCPNCNRCLDMRRIGWVEKDGRVIAVYCDKCKPSIIIAARNLADLPGNEGFSFGIPDPSKLPRVINSKKNPFPYHFCHRHTSDGVREFLPHSALRIPAWRDVLAVCHDKENKAWHAVNVATGVAVVSHMASLKKLIAHVREMVRKYDVEDYLRVVGKEIERQKKTGEWRG